MQTLRSRFIHWSYSWNENHEMSGCRRIFVQVFYKLCFFVLQPVANYLGKLKNWLTFEERVESDTIVACFCIDDKFSVHIPAELCSLLSNNVQSQFRIYIVSEKPLSKVNSENINKIARHFGNCEIVYQQFSYDDLQDFDVSYSNYETHFRLMMAEFFPSEDKMLWLDSDLVFDGNIAPLWDADISNKLIAGSREHIFTELDGWFDERYKTSGWFNCENYLNAGVLLMNLRRLREEHYFEKFKLSARKIRGEGKGWIRHADQDIVNMTIPTSGIKFLNRKWNWVLIQDEHRPVTVRTARIFHWTGKYKSWLVVPEHLEHLTPLHYRKQLALEVSRKTAEILEN